MVDAFFYVFDYISLSAFLCLVVLFLESKSSQSSRPYGIQRNTMDPGLYYSFSF